MSDEDVKNKEDIYEGLDIHMSVFEGRAIALELPRKYI